MRVVNGAHAADADESLNPVFVSENLTDKVIRVRQREPLIVLRARPLPAGITSLAPGAVFCLCWVVCIVRGRQIFLPDRNLDEIPGRLLECEQRFHLTIQIVITSAGLTQETSPFGWFEFQGGVEKSADLIMPFGGHLDPQKIPGYASLPACSFDHST
ncbi:MAG: hypothetical protein ACREAM_26100, partial [Blastocatellia bacterium]